MVQEGIRNLNQQIAREEAKAEQLRAKAEQRYARTLSVPFVFARRPPRS